MQWPRLAMPTPAIVTSGWAAPRAVGGKQGIHGSLDFANELNDPIAAVADGEVVAVAQGSGETGKYVLIEHSFPGGLTLLSRYIHLNGFNVVAGQRVRRGDTIGYAGNSGVGGAIHLHFDTHVCGEAAVQSYQRTFGWPRTTERPLIKATLPGCQLVPSEPLVQVSGYRSGVVNDAAAYGIMLLRDRTDLLSALPSARSMPTPIKVLIALGLVATAAGTAYFLWEGGGGPAGRSWRRHLTLPQP